jgi:hypothetical protein
MVAAFLRIPLAVAAWAKESPAALVLGAGRMAPDSAMSPMFSRKEVSLNVLALGTGGSKRKGNIPPPPSAAQE